MYVSSFLKAKETMRNVMNELKRFPLGESAAIILLLIEEHKYINRTMACTIMHTDAVSTGIERLLKFGYIHLERNGRCKNYIFNSDGAKIAGYLVKQLEKY